MHGYLALGITALMFVTMVAAAPVIHLLFSDVGLIPHTRPTISDVCRPRRGSRATRI